VTKTPTIKDREEARERGREKEEARERERKRIDAMYRMRADRSEGDTIVGLITAF